LAVRDLDRLPLNDADRAYLKTTGLPQDSDWTLTFGPTEPHDELSPGMVTIGNDGGVPICVDTQSGRVVVRESDHEVRLVSSSLPMFGKFVALYDTYRRTVIDLHDAAEIAALISRIEGEMIAVDPDAMSHPDHYWPVVVEQMRDGLL
jgi:hypothetical protein